MLISEKRLRKLIIEEVTSAVQSDDPVVVSDDGSCFSTSRRRFVPSGLLRSRHSDAGASLAMDWVMTAIMNHPDLDNIATTDMDWKILDDEWDDAREYITVTGRGCFKDCNTNGTIEFRRYCLSLEDEEADSTEVGDDGVPHDTDNLDDTDSSDDTADTADTADTGDMNDMGDTDDD